MEYVLAIGINCFKYQKNPNIKIFLNDTLIDDYELTGEEKTLYKNKLKLSNKMIGKTISPKAPETIWLNICNKLKFYTINDNILKESNTLSININNSDSNYSNNFMTKSTLINPEAILFWPKEYTINNSRAFIEFNKKMQLSLSRLSRIPNYINEKIDIETDQRLKTYFLCKGPNLKTKHKDYEQSYFIQGWPYPYFCLWRSELNAPRPISLDPNEDAIGGNGTLECKIIKKFGIYMFDDSSIQIEDELISNTVMNDNEITNFMIKNENPVVDQTSTYDQHGLPNKFFIKDFFPISGNFIGLCCYDKVNKYLYEN